MEASSIGPPPPPQPTDQQPRRRRPRPHNPHRAAAQAQAQGQGQAPPDLAGVELPDGAPSGSASVSGPGVISLPAQPRADGRRGRGRAPDGPADVQGASNPDDGHASRPSQDVQHQHHHSAPSVNGNVNGTGEEPAHRRRRRRPGKHHERDVEGGNPSAGTGAPGASTGQRRDTSTGPSASSSTVGDDTVHARGHAHSQPQQAQGARPDRRKKFGAQLTAPSNPSGAPPTTRAHAHPPPPSSNADLTTRLTYTLSHPPYADCPICFSPLHPAQPLWACAPSPPGTPAVANNCWTPFHLRCIREWAGKSVRETRDAWAARGEARAGEWRCPGCQTRRTDVPREYRCFCARVAQPAAGRMSTPHSCGEKCARVRAACEHACPLACHPGPCPPCVVTVQRACYCSKKLLALRCSHVTGAHPPDLTCGLTCGKALGCGKHQCERECHAGECAPCEVREGVRCYCGKEQRDVACGDGAAKRCVDPAVGERWEGRFECESPCGRAFRCGVHRCERRCHPPPLAPPPCPTDPAVVTTCPCTQTPLAALPNGTRGKCTDPVPCCDKVCARPLGACEHLCPLACHAGPCPPCLVPLALSCRCGETVRTVACSTATSSSSSAASEEVLCDRPCRALRHCGRHACARVCCPLAWQGKVAKGKRRALEQALLGRPEEDPDGWHECDIVCGKLLGCRIHTCTLPDHRGACPRCLQSSFDELVCHCGRTVLMPPIPCGTVLDCPFPCARAPPPCGHPKTAHTCHADGEGEGGCPPCPFLTTKRCACGKALVANVRCSAEKVGCGAVCGRLLDCGFHSCERLCHAAGACEPCAQVCGKPRRACGHPCAVQCHAPAACPEAEPCPARVTLVCACGRIKQQALCGACTAQPTSRAATQLKCGQECAVAKRNARLAEALGIPDGGSGSAGRAKLGAVEWPDRLVLFFRENREWAALAERNLGEFVQGTKKTQVLPPLVAPRQRFMHELANVYRLDVDYVDAGANRSAQLVRRIDSRVPAPLLSEVAAPAPAAPLARQTGGNLVSLNRPKPPAVAAPAGRAWAASMLPKQPSVAAVVAAPPPVPAPVASSWGAPIARPSAASASISRTATPSAAAAVHASVAPVAAQPSEPVRDSWEDD